jgi:hypothetical protein
LAVIYLRKPSPSKEKIGFAKEDAARFTRMHVVFAIIFTEKPENDASEKPMNG